MIALAVLVATAISLKAPVEQAAAALQVRDPGETFNVQGAASGVLVLQIEQGSPVDLFVSASPDEVDRLEGDHLLVPGSRTAIATNRLVVVVRKGLAPPSTWEGIEDPRFAKIAIGNPETVPAGRYAQQALRSVGLVRRVGTRLVYGENVRQVLDWVVRGEADAAVVYATEAKLAGAKVVDGPAVPDRLHDPIVYEAALVRGDKKNPRADKLLDFLASPAGEAILAKHGFGPPPSP